MTDVHPARAAARRSMDAVELGDREAWLANFSGDAVVEDPIGVSAFDPEGRGHRGIDAIGAFWDQVIGPNKISFAIEESHASGNEVANVGAITTTLPDGTKAVVRGVFTYAIDDDGKVTSLRAYWNMDEDMTLEPA